MNFNKFPIYHSFLNAKAGMDSTIGPKKKLRPGEEFLLFDTIAVMQTIKRALESNGIVPENFNDNTVLTLSPLVVNGEYAKPDAFYELALKDNFIEYPAHARTVVPDLINLIAGSKAVPENRVRYQALRKISKRILKRFPELPETYRLLSISEHCQLYLIAQRFMFIAYGDTGVPRDPKGHIDLFGFDLKGIVENYISGRELNTADFKLPTMLGFTNIPAVDRTNGGAIMIKENTLPVRHTWVELRGRDTWVHDCLTLDFNTVAQTYVNDPATALTDARWEDIKAMLKLTGDISNVCYRTNKYKKAS